MKLKKCIAFIIAMSILFTMLPINALVVWAIDPTLQSLIDAAENGATIVLNKNYNEVITIPEEKTITINLNGHNITGNGVVRTNETLSNNRNASTILNKGTLTITGTGEVKANGNYAVCNHGTMTIENGTFIGVPQASTIDNGWYNGSQNSSQALSTMVINGGTISSTEVAGGYNVVKNDDWGHLTINGGTFNATVNNPDPEGNIHYNAVQCHNVAIINGGTFNGEVRTESYNISASDQYDLTINGGTFNDIVNILKNSKITITDGTFNKGIWTSEVNVTTNISGGTYVPDEEVYYLKQDETVEWEDDIIHDAGANALNGLRGSITYESDDEEVATVGEDGIITGVGAGKTTITATICNGMEATVDVFIVAAVKDVDSEDSTDEYTEKTANDQISDMMYDILVNGEDAEIIGITQEEAEVIKNAILDGKVITTNVTVDPEDEEDVADDTKDLIKETGNLADTAKVEYYDINVVLSADGMDDIYVTQLGEEIYITFPLSEDFTDVPKNCRRTYKVIKIHNYGTEEEPDIRAEKVKVTQNNDGTITVKASEFSLYAVTYTDKAISSGGGGSTVEDPEEPTDTQNPDYSGLTKALGESQDLVPGNTAIPFILQSEDEVLTVKNLKASFPDATILEDNDMVLKTGTEVTINGETKVIVIYGDTNGDGRINIMDAVTTLNHVKGKATLEGAFFAAADLNNNKSINIMEAVGILNVVKGKAEFKRIASNPIA